jgi:hypothetical protein
MKGTQPREDPDAAEASPPARRTFPDEDGGLACSGARFRVPMPARDRLLVGWILTEDTQNFRGYVARLSCLAP